jgi:hypothetical protein
MKLLCETCGNDIAKPADGWVEWTATKRPDSDVFDVGQFRVCHHTTASPMGQCYMHNSDGRMGHHLGKFSGRTGLTIMLAMMMEHSDNWQIDHESLGILIDRLHGDGTISGGSFHFDDHVGRK